MCVAEFRSRGNATANVAYFRIIGAGFGALTFPSLADAACTFSSPCGSAPVSLGTIDAATGTSVALGTNADGSVIVGQSATGLFDQSGHTLYHAFRSTADGQVSDLGTLGNIPGVSIATATNSDGSVVVGQSATSLTDTFGTTLSHAFRWTINDGMTDLGRSKTSLGIREQTVPARMDQSLSASARHHKIRMGPATTTPSVGPNGRDA